MTASWLSSDVDSPVLAVLAVVVVVVVVAAVAAGTNVIVSAT